MPSLIDLELFRPLKEAGIRLITTEVSGYQNLSHISSMYVVGGGVPEPLRRAVQDYFFDLADECGFVAAEAGSLCHLELDLEALEIRWLTTERQYTDNPIEEELYLPQFIGVEATLHGSTGLGKQLHAADGDINLCVDDLVTLRDFALRHEAAKLEVNDGRVRALRAQAELQPEPSHVGRFRFDFKVQEQLSLFAPSVDSL